MREVKIIATIGPSSHDKSVLKNMKKNGMSIARINTKYGDIDEFDRVYDILKEIKTKIMFDINSKKYLEYISSKNPDWVAISYAEDKSQILEIKSSLPPRVKIISKIETQKGIDNIEEIIKYSDGVMVARGDLGKNISIEKVPINQKIIIRKVNEKNKFSITATEMLLSMVNSKSPSRSEVSDVANAVLDNSSALMLSEETAIGKYPSTAIRFMRKIINATLSDEKRLH